MKFRAKNEKDSIGISEMCQKLTPPFLFIPCGQLKIRFYFTGRTNQLRVHMKHCGHVIVGDYRYSNRTEVTPYRMMLHAHRLVIPMRKEVIDVTAPDPFLTESDSMWKPTKVFNTYKNFVMENPIKYCTDTTNQKGRSRDKYGKKYRHLEGGEKDEKMLREKDVSR